MAESSAAAYTEESIRSLDWKEHIRLRPGMYIGKLGDGSSPDDGVYVLLKEVIDNAIDEHVMGHGTTIQVEIEGTRVTVRDRGRGIPLGKLMDCAARINTGAKYDSEAFKKSVGLNGVGIKAVNALSGFFEIQAFRSGETRAIEFAAGEVEAEMKRNHKTSEPDGTQVVFEPDGAIFPGRVRFDLDIVRRMCRYYAYLNPGLTMMLNGERIRSKNGLLDLLNEVIDDDPLYPPIHLRGTDIEIAFTHTGGFGEDYYSFVNGQHTTQGGTHLAAFREAVAQTVRDFYKKAFEASDIRQSIAGAVAVRVEEPVFESQTKTKLGSTHMAPDGQTIRAFVGGFIREQLDNYLHKHPETAEALLKRITAAERERKELKGIRKLARERAKKAKLCNRKLRDCRIHFNTRNKRAEESTLFITEGDSASGSITKSRDVETQAVFSLKGKPLNSFGLTKKVVYENEEFNLLQAALNIEDSMDDLRYNRVVIATDADVDGMHIRLLLLTFFLQFFPEVIRQGHLYILQTPLFRVRNKKKTHYCYSEEEKREAVSALGARPEITRFKGLGEISPDEFRHFIGEEIRLDPVRIGEHAHLKDLLAFYMGKNTPDRQRFIVGNLRVEIDEAAEGGVESESPAA